MPGNRKSIRLKDYDYIQRGAYFVTICGNSRKCVFGDVKNGKMELNDAGEMAHINIRAPIRGAPTAAAAVVLGEIIGAFKSMSTNEYIRNVKNNNWPSFDKHLWQRNFYEYVIRDESDLNRIREYIINNPAGWGKDEYYSS